MWHSVAIFIFSYGLGCRGKMCLRGVRCRKNEMLIFFIKDDWYLYLVTVKIFLEDEVIWNYVASGPKGPVTILREERVILFCCCCFCTDILGRCGILTWLVIWKHSHPLVDIVSFFGGCISFLCQAYFPTQFSEFGHTAVAWSICQRRKCVVKRRFIASHNSWWRLVMFAH